MNYYRKLYSENEKRDSEQEGIKKLNNLQKAKVKVQKNKWHICDIGFDNYLCFYFTDWMHSTHGILS